MQAFVQELMSFRLLLAGLSIFLALGCVSAPRPEAGGNNSANGLYFVERQDGLGVRYFARGNDGDARVILLASLGRPASDFDHLASALSGAGYRTIAVDVRGVGRSDLFGAAASITLFDLADDVEAALVADGAKTTERIYVVGHAFGNRLARAYATRYPERVKGIALLAAGGSQDIEEDPKAAQSLRDSFNAELSEEERNNAIRYAFFADENAPPDEWLTDWHKDGALFSVAAVQNTPEKLWRAGGGHAPMLVIQAAEDRISPAEKTSSLLKAEFPQRTIIVTLSPAGHALLPEKPFEIYYYVRSFFRSIEECANKRGRDDGCSEPAKLL